MFEHLRVNGCSLRIKRSGPDHGPVIVLSNSLAADMSMWDAQTHLLERDFQVIRMDTRGHGGSSDTAGDYTLDALADDVLAILDELAIERVHFVGLSLGGMIGQVLGARNHDRLDSLTLCATFADTDRTLWADRVQAVRAKGVPPLVEGTIERWFTPAFRKSSPAVIGGVRRMISGTSTNGYAGCAAAIRDMDLTGIPEKIGVPTLIIAASEDSSATPESMKHLHSRIPDARYAEIRDAAHLFTLEQPTETTALLHGFLQNVHSQSTDVAASTHS